MLQLCFTDTGRIGLSAYTAFPSPDLSYSIVTYLDSYEFVISVNEFRANKMASATRFTST